MHLFYFKNNILENVGKRNKQSPQEKFSHTKLAGSALATVYAVIK